MSSSRLFSAGSRISFRLCSHAFGMTLRGGERLRFMLEACLRHDAPLAPEPPSVALGCPIFLRALARAHPCAARLRPSIRSMTSS